MIKHANMLSPWNQSWVNRFTFPVFDQGCSGSPQPKAVPPRVSRWARGRGVAAPEVATSATSAVLPGQVQGDAEQRERLGR